MHVNKVSVIVPIFKVRNFIERCACSLFEQTLKEIEYIFVDDASPDDSIEILKSCIERYPERKEYVRILTHEKNKGLTSARNSGLAVATGLYIAHCDADDYVDRDMYKLLYEKAESINADFVFCDFYFKYKCDNLIRYTTPPLTDKSTLMKAYIRSSWTVVWNILAKRDVYETHGLQSPKNITYCEDFHLAVRLMYFSKIICKVEAPLYYYNQENSSSIMHGVNQRHAIDERLVYGEIINFFMAQGIFEEYKREIAWRVLKNKQDLVLNGVTHKDFMSIQPWTHKYILSCPKAFCNRKIKIMMWLLSHNCRFLLLPILYIRHIWK